MKRGQYNPIVMDHFAHPRNVGVLAGADGVGSAGDAAEGDVMRIHIRVRDERIVEISFQCKGCPAAVASGSMVTELAKGRSLDEAAEITDEMVAAALGGLPEGKRGCSNLGAEALANAIWDYVVRAVERNLAERLAGP